MNVSFTKQPDLFGCAVNGRVIAKRHFRGNNEKRPLWVHDARHFDTALPEGAGDVWTEVTAEPDDEPAVIVGLTDVKQFFVKCRDDVKPRQAVRHADGLRKDAVERGDRPEPIRTGHRAATPDDYSSGIAPFASNFFNSEARDSARSSPIALAFRRKRSKTFVLTSA